MTAGRFFKVLFIVAAFLFAAFVWPTRYRDIPGIPDHAGVTHPMRVDRITKRVDIRMDDGHWKEYLPPPPEFDPRHSVTGHAVDKAQEAGDDIRKMNEVAKEAVNQGTLGR